MQTERGKFRDFWGLHKDGKLDGMRWAAGICPAQDQPLVEASHLLHGRLSKAEILGTWTMLMASQASNHAEDLTRHHAEPEPRERVPPGHPVG